MEHWSLSERLTQALADVVQRIQRSLVLVSDGRRGSGAGVIWRREGYILTNNHVVARGQVWVKLPHGPEVTAQLIARAPEMDLALLKVATHDLTPAPIADSRNLRVGQIVLALGHPWGQPGVVTAGILSGLGSAVTRGRHGTVPILRSDVPLAPGNSGGPLVNITGGVIGINTMIIGGDLSVAIPSHIAEQFVAQALAEREGALV